MKKILDFITPNMPEALGTTDSVSIQNAVNLAHDLGINKVVIPRQNARTGKMRWDIDTAVLLPSDMTVVLDNCYMRFCDGIFDNMFRNANYDTPLGYTLEGRQHDIHILGTGNAVLDGGVHNGFTEYTQKGPDKRPMYYNSFINMMNVERLSVKNIRMLEMRYWALTFHYCADGHISDIDFDAPHSAINQDGIDLRTGCNNFIIENITGITGDDTIALTNLRCRYDEAMSPTGLSRDIHHVIIRNVNSTTPCGLIRLLNHGGKKLYNVTIENIIERESELFRAGSCVRIGENSYYGDDIKAQLGDTFNITVRNVQSRSRMGVRVNCALDNAVFDNIQMFDKGGTAVYFGPGDFRNIKVSNTGYSMLVTPKDTDDNRIEGNTNQRYNDPVSPDRTLNAVYFKESNAENISFENIHAHSQLTSVFGGNGSVTMKASGIVRDDPNVPLFDGELKASKMTTDEF
nr:hypothetical protein [Clostridia bacterium]